MNNEKKIAIMQPYFFPYIGYFQLIKAVDVFVMYDEGFYITRGWMNKNRILCGSSEVPIRINIANASCNKKIYEIELNDDIIFTPAEKRKYKLNYCRAPFFEETMPIIEEIMTYSERNLFKFLRNEIQILCRYLGIKTEFITSSEIEKMPSNTATGMIFSVCDAMDIHNYVNAIGGQEFYDKDYFKKDGNVNLSFIKTNEIKYKQHSNKGEFVPNLSIIDVLMNCGKEKTAQLLDEYTLI